MSEKVAGLDLGTGNSAIAVINEAGEVQMAVNSNGNYTTPSVVLFKDGERTVGEAAKRQLVMNPKSTVSFIKRFMGADWNDPDVQRMKDMATYEVVNVNGKPRVKISGKEYSPEEISSHIVGHMKKIAEDFYGTDVKKVVITCPAFFNDAQRQATKLAGEMAGLEVLRVINEPTAAILASDLDTKEDKTVAVVDLGCGTYDVSIVEISNVDGQSMYEVLASHGDVFLGGQNYDNALVDYICDEFQKDHGIDLRKDQMAYSRVISAAEKAKIELSSSSSTDINEPYITVLDGTPLMLTMNITRAKFEQITAELTDRVIELTREAIKKANVDVNDIDCFLLVGGSTRIPSVQEAWTKTFNRPLNKSVNPDHAVALGAAQQAYSLVGGANAKDILLLDVTPLSLGLETEGGLMTVMIPHSTTIPTEKSEVFSTAVDNQPAVTIMVYQGERKFARDNKLIGQFTLDGIAPARRGIPKVNVKFAISADGILNVTAVDEATGKEQHITIENKPLSDDEIARIKAEAEANEEADKKKAEEVTEMNQVESAAYSLKNTLDEDKVKEQLTEDEIKSVTEKVDAVLEATKTKEIEKVREAAKEMRKAFEPLASKLYAAPEQPVQEPVNESANTESAAKADSVQDVEFEEVKE